MLQKTKIKRRLFSLLAVISISVYGQSIPYSGGRIVISSDGNEHDHDDWAATPFSLALLAAKKLQDSLVIYSFSDHIWGSNHLKTEARKQMKISALEGKNLFHFKKSIFIEAVQDSIKAISEIAKEINKSNKNSPLTIIAAGPMHLVGSALANAEKTKLKFVRLISHSNWNNNHSDMPHRWEHHSGWTWKEIKNRFESSGLICDRIKDQNGGTDYEGLKAPQSMFDWIKTSPIRKTSETIERQLDWLYQRQLTCVKKGDFDPSDAGMIIYLLTGKQKTNPEDARAIIENPVP